MRAWIRFSFIAFSFSLPVLAHAQAETQSSSQPQSAPATPATSPAPAAPATSQTPAALPNDGVLLGPVANHQISLDVVVTDKAGNPQSGLQQQDFTILDDKQPENILTFRATDENSTAAEPLQVVLLVDAVNTGIQTMGYERLQLDKFLRQDGGHLALPTSLVFLTDTSTEIQPTTTRDGNGLADLLKSKETGLRIINRSQGYYGAIDRFNLSVGALEKLTNYEARQPGRKLLIWFSSGWPMLSGPRTDLSRKSQDFLFSEIVALSQNLREARITLYSLDPLGTSDAASFRAFYYESFLKGVPASNKVMPGNLALQVLAVQSGGRVLNANNDLTKLIANCLIDAKAYYTLSFTYPRADHPNEFHSLDVKVDKPGLTARTRTGYYAQPYNAGR